jgi:hypothetical protein
LSAPGFGKPTAPERALAKASSNLQFFNPIAGKGVTEAKPRGTDLGSLPDRLVDWFDAWMKVRALQKALLAYRVDDDFKILVLAPGAIPMHHLAGLRMNLLKQRLWGSVRLGVEAALTLAELLVRRSPASALAPDYDPFPFPSGATPRDVVHGFACAYFKKLGPAPATMNVSFLGLPGWFPVDTPQQVDDWLSILDEYRRRVRNLREDFSDHVPTLLAFRDFVSGGRLEDGLDLFGAYATLLLQQGERLVPFRADNLRRVLMAYATERPSLAEIIQDDGFKNVAKAIRACTIRAQYHKAALDSHRRSDPMRVDIRYGLAQEWKRFVDRKEPFVERLAEFVAEFNAEAARRREKQDPHEQPVSADDLEHVIRLIERDGSSSLVGKLLIAFGYASDWRGADQRDEQPSSGSVGNTDREDNA